MALKSPWLENQIFALISACKVEECLYKKNHQHYKNKEACDAAFKRVYDKVRIIRFEVTEIECHEKWWELQKQFKEEDKKTHGASTWPFYQEMKFIKDAKFGVETCAEGIDLTERINSCLSLVRRGIEQKRTNQERLELINKLEYIALGYHTDKDKDKKKKEKEEKEKKKKDKDKKHKDVFKI